MDQEFRAFVAKDYGRHLKICRALLARRKVAGFTLEQLTADLAQDAADRAIRRADRGWFDDAPRVSYAAQARKLLGLSTIQALRDMNAAAKRRHVPLEAGPRPGERETKVPEPLIVPAKLLDGCIETERRERLRRAVLGLENASRRLYLIALSFPDELAREHLEQAAAFRAGGARPLVRPVDEAWALFSELRDRPGLVDDDAAWKRAVAEVFRLSTPFGSARRGQVNTAVNAVDQILRRGRADLELLLEDEEGDR